MEEKFEELLESMVKRPGMYFSTNSLINFSIYLDGYCSGLVSAGKPDPLSAWWLWVQMKFCIRHSAWHWTRILLHTFGSEQACIDKLVELYLEYKRDFERLGWQGIEDEQMRRLVERYGKEVGCPSESNTSNPDWL